MRAEPPLRLGRALIQSRMDIHDQRKSRIRRARHDRVVAHDATLGRVNGKKTSPTKTPAQLQPGDGKGNQSAAKLRAKAARGAALPAFQYDGAPPDFVHWQNGRSRGLPDAEVKSDQ